MAVQVLVAGSLARPALMLCRSLFEDVVVAAWLAFHPDADAAVQSGAAAASACNAAGSMAAPSARATAAASFWQRR
jgi:hypothetical protein